MSQFGPGQQSQNPYRPSAPAGYGNHPYGKKLGPYGPKPGGPDRRPPRKSGLLWLWILLGVGGFGLFGCCSCCMFSYIYASNKDAKFVEQTYRDNPIVKEHIGDVISVKANHSASFAEEDETTWIFDVKGSKGSGQFIVKSRSNLDDVMQIQWAKLKMSDGTTYNLDGNDRLDAGGRFPF